MPNSTKNVASRICVYAENGKLLKQWSIQSFSFNESVSVRLHDYDAGSKITKYQVDTLPGKLRINAALTPATNYTVEESLAEDD